MLEWAAACLFEFFSAHIPNLKLVPELVQQSSVGALRPVPHATAEQHPE